MSIENNTTKLQNLLSQVNNLPDAGSGGSIKFAIGFKHPGEGLKNAGTEIFKVTGLGFTPKHVIVHTTSGATTDQRNVYIFGMIQRGLTDAVTIFGQKNTSTNISLSPYNAQVELSINSDGFTLMSNSDELYTSEWYQYVAIGAESVSLIEGPSDDTGDSGDDGPGEDEIPEI